MQCSDLSRLRERATELHRLLAVQRKRARAHAVLERGWQPPGRSDYEAMLWRRLSALGAQIDRHRDQHACD